jgi:hypothetical protein
MFSVLFEVQPKAEKWDEYLNNAKMLRPELEQIDGFVDNIRYKSMQRDAPPPHRSAEVADLRQCCFGLSSIRNLPSAGSSDLLPPPSRDGNRKAVLS